MKLDFLKNALITTATVLVTFAILKRTPVVGGYVNKLIG